MAKSSVESVTPEAVEEIGVKLVDVAADAAVAKANSETNKDTANRIEQRLDTHMANQEAQFNNVYTKLDKYAAQSTAQHDDLAKKVNNIPQCIQVSVATGLEPIRKLWLRSVFALIAALFATIAYLITLGTPWGAELDRHNGTEHASIR